MPQEKSFPTPDFGAWVRQFIRLPQEPETPGKVTVNQLAIAANMQYSAISRLINASRVDPAKLLKQLQRARDSDNYMLRADRQQLEALEKGEWRYVPIRPSLETIQSIGKALVDFGILNSVDEAMLAAGWIPEGYTAVPNGSPEALSYEPDPEARRLLAAFNGLPPEFKETAIEQAESLLRSIRKTRPDAGGKAD